jgi:hypothetical protein
MDVIRSDDSRLSPLKAIKSFNEAHPKARFFIPTYLKYVPSPDHSYVD